jgi:polyisoprenoid-binding protein YceI
MSVGSMNRAPRGPMAAVVLLSVFLGSLLSATAGHGGVTTWEFDKAHSNPSFSIRHLFAMVPGRFSDFSGTIRMDDQKIENSTVEVTIQAASISTDNAKRDAHLKGADFFEVDTFPTITFRSTKFEPTDTKDLYRVTGDLTIRDVTRPVVLQAQILGMGPDPFSPGGKRGGFLASTTINRLDFGVKWNKTFDGGGALLGDEVKIEFPIEAVARPAAPEGKSS